MLSDFEHFSRPHVKAYEKMPLYDYLGENGLTFDQIQDRRANWLRTDPKIQLLKANGLWISLASPSGGGAAKAAERVFFGKTII